MSGGPFVVAVPQWEECATEEIDSCRIGGRLVEIHLTVFCGHMNILVVTKSSTHHT